MIREGTLVSWNAATWLAVVKFQEVGPTRVADIPVCREMTAVGMVAARRVLVYAPAGVTVARWCVIACYV